MPKPYWGLEGLEKFSVFVFLSVCMWRDSGRRNYPIYMKFCTNIYVLSEINCTVFGVHCLNSACTWTHKSIYTLRLMKENESLFLPVCVCTGSSSRNYPIRLKCVTNVYALREISCLLFGECCPSGAFTEIHKSYLNGLRGKYIYYL